MTTATPGAVHHTPAGDLSANRASCLRALRAANLSPLTLRTYADAVDRLADYAVANDLPSDVADIGRPQLEAFLADQVARWKPATAANRYRGLPGENVPRVGLSDSPGQYDHVDVHPRTGSPHIRGRGRTKDAPDAARAPA